MQIHITFPEDFSKIQLPPIFVLTFHRDDLDIKASPVSNTRFDFGSPNGSPNRSVRFSHQVLTSECDFTLHKSDVTVTNK